MILADGRGGVLTGSAPLVVGAGGELVLDAGVDQDQLVTLGIEGEVLVFQGFAVETDKGALLSEYGSELVHNAALHAAVVVLCALADLGKFELVDIVAKDVVEGESEGTFKGRRGAQACAEGDVARKNGVETLDLAAALYGLTAYAENIARPLLLRGVLFLQAKFHELVIVERKCPDLGFDCSYDTAVDCAREDIAAIIVGMLADKVDTSGRGVQGRSFAEESLEFFLDLGFHFL